MRDLTKVVPDIYTHLQSLSDGVALPLTEKDINLTVEGIREALLSWAKPEERNKDFTIRMSNVGKPARQLWFEQRDKDSKKDIDAPTQLKFLYGHLLEEIVLMLVRMSGHQVTDEQKEVDINGIKGHQVLHLHLFTKLTSCLDVSARVVNKCGVGGLVHLLFKATYHVVAWPGHTLAISSRMGQTSSAFRCVRRVASWVFATSVSLHLEASTIAAAIVWVRAIVDFAVCRGAQGVWQ